MAKSIAVFIAKGSNYETMPAREREALVRSSDSKVKDSKLTFYTFNHNETMSTYQVRAGIEAEIAKGKLKHESVLFLSGGRTFAIQHTERRRMAMASTKPSPSFQYF